MQGIFKVVRGAYTYCMAPRGTVGRDINIWSRFAETRKMPADEDLMEMSSEEGEWTDMVLKGHEGHKKRKVWRMKKAAKVLKIVP